MSAHTRSNASATPPIRAVTPWLWRRLLRDHWPGDRGSLLTLLLLSTYMDGKLGMTHVLQETLAGKTGVDVRTIRRHLAKARELGFLGLMRLHRRQLGQGWNRVYWQAHIPANLNLSSQDAALANTVGSIDDKAFGASLEPTKAQPYSRSTGHRTAEAPDTQRTKDRTLEVEGQDTQRPDSFDAEAPDTGEESYARDDADSSFSAAEKGPDNAEKKAPDNSGAKSYSGEVLKTGVVTRSDRSVAARAIPNAGKAEAEQERVRKALVYLKAMPGASADELRKLYDVTPEEIRRVVVAP
jgi:hypothetical protein